MMFFVSFTDCKFCGEPDRELTKRALDILLFKNPVAEVVDRLCDAYDIYVERENAQLLLLAMTSRLLREPVHTLVMGSVGLFKTYLTHAISQAIPPCRRVWFGGTNVRNLAGCESIHPFSVVVWEDLPEPKGLGKEILKKIFVDGIDINQEGIWVDCGRRMMFLKWKPKRFQLVIIRINEFKDNTLNEMMLRIDVSHISEWKNKVLKSLVDPVMVLEREEKEDMWLQSICAFNELAQRCIWKVEIPFRGELEKRYKKLPPTQANFWFFKNLLGLISASAIWHYLHRNHNIDFETRTIQVIADLEDYNYVLRLLSRSAESKKVKAWERVENEIPPTATVGGLVRR